jgi:phenylacetate 2-hydroxylase
MSGGFETLYSTAIITIGMLSTQEGQEIQKMAYEDIMSHYDTPEEAFENCLTEEKSKYIIGLVKEALRFYPPLKLLPARQTYKDFIYQGSSIPKGVLVYLNTQAVNRGKIELFLLQTINSSNKVIDKLTYGPDADQFRPERWTEKSYDVPPPYHFAFGGGARMCTAVNFSNRVLYAVFLRLIISFQITEGVHMPANTHYVDYKRDPAESNSIPSEFKVKLMPRDQETLKRCLQQSEKALDGFMTGHYAETLVK